MTLKIKHNVLAFILYLAFLIFLSVIHIDTCATNLFYNLIAV